MDTTLTKKYSELKAAEDDIKLKRAAAQARLEDAKAKLAGYVAEVKAMGFGSVGQFQKAITEAESELKILLENAEAKLKAGGYED